MAKLYSPSDYTSKDATISYSTGEGYYTNVGLVAGLLQIPEFTGSTNPTEGDVGEYIKRVEDYIDEKTGISYRPIIYKDEVHNFKFTGFQHLFPTYWFDYVGFIQLSNRHIRKMIKLEVWQGNSWKDLASSAASITIASGNRAVSSTITLTMPDGSTAYALTNGTTAATFNNTYGAKTTALELVALINETFPTHTHNITGGKEDKAPSASGVSKHFYATIDSEDQTKVVITSLLIGEDGSDCTIAVSGAGLSKSDFVDQETMKRMGSWWKIEDEGRIFFRTNFPYLEKNSIRVTYIAGNHRVPGIIADAATKLVACEILRHDDQTVLIAESGAQIDIKGKYDLLKAESSELLKLTSESIFLIE